MVNVPKFGTPVSDKMAYANSANPDQTAPEGEQSEVFENLGHLLCAISPEIQKIYMQNLDRFFLISLHKCTGW